MSPDEPDDFRCDVVLEQTLGHVTHSQNLQRLLPGVPRFEPTFLPIPYEVEGWSRHLPGYANWTLRAGLRARRALKRRRKSDRDANFVHTQVPAVLLGKLMDNVPTVVSLDATPKQYDRLGEHYAHDVGGAWLENAKERLNRRCFERAVHLVTWSEWTKQSLVDEYGVAAEKITVIPPGVDTGRWLRADSNAPQGERPIRILFVGGNLRRKGGDLLREVFTELRRVHGPAIELHMVTPEPVHAGDGIVVHAAMRPNSPELISLYHRCHIFCLPTLGDCLPMVLPEAGAAGLALVSTDVGAISEIVRDGETGLLVPVGDAAALSRALERLVNDGDLRLRLSRNARDQVLAEHDAATNAGRLADTIRFAAR